MSHLAPLRTGAAVALTIVILYVACLLAVWIAPGAVTAVFSNWVHGLNLEPLTNPPPLLLSRALLGLLLVSTYFIVAGAVYGLVRQWPSPAPAARRE